MSDRRRRLFSWHRARELSLAVFALWLVVQNLLLLAFVPWAKLGPIMVVVNAIIKAAFFVMAPLWALPVVAMLGAVVTAHWMKRTRPATEADRWEVRHG